MMPRAENNRKPTVLRNIRAQQQRFATGIGTLMVREVKRLMRESPRSGRLYGRHRASAPGEPPAIRTRRLYNSVTSRVTLAPPRWTVDVGSSLKYAGFLERGTRHMKRRPVWGVAARNIRADITDLKRRIFGGR
jgi:hypothetical protein